VPFAVLKLSQGGTEMRRIIVTLALTCIALWTTSAVTRKAPTKNPPVPTAEPRTTTPAANSALVVTDTFILAEYDFEDGGGGPDAQGWTSADNTIQDPYFHVDDFSSVGPPFAPLEGTKSLWCGQESIVGCATCPGYGTGWIQYFESVPFASTGNVSVSFLVEYDSEESFDYIYFQYLSKSGIWQTLKTYTGIGSELASVVVPQDSLVGSVKLRFYFRSDAGWDDEDGNYNSNGAVILDSLTVIDNSGVIDFQDFEAETVGALATADGDWTATSYPPFGDYTGLFDGSTVLQEDSVVVNNTHLWGFFNGSTDDYACGGHPEQPAVPHAEDPDLNILSDFLHNEIRSPLIELHEDENGTPITDPLGGLLLEYDVYRDLPLDNLVFYVYRVRYLVDGEFTTWDTDGNLYHSATTVTDWYRQVHDVSYSYVEGATHVQVAIGCRDGLPLFFNFGSGDCHSHSPLIDNVRVIRTVNDPFVVTNTNDSGAGSLRQAITDANDQPGIDVIEFDIPGAGPHVISVLSNLPWFKSAKVDATTQPGYSGTPLVVLDGGGLSGGVSGPVLKESGTELRGFEIRNFQYDGLSVSEVKNAVVQQNYIHNNGNHGLTVEGSTAFKNLIGGLTPDLGNTITNNGLNGIWLTHGSSGHSFLCNSISGNGELGIDLVSTASYLVEANDDQDPDTGNNNHQNFPVLRWADSGTSSIGASLNSKPSTTFLIQLFANAGCDGSGHGEGETYLGSTEVTTGPGGNVDFAVITDVAFADGDFITATATSDDGSTSEFCECLEVSPATAVDDEVPVARASLHAAVPNPFNPSTVIRYDVPAPGVHVRIVVYDVTGRRVATLVDGHKAAGEKRVTWDGSNDHGAEVATGVYFYRMTAPGFSQTRKMVLVK
jgi:hypothetical protein